MKLAKDISCGLLGTVGAIGLVDAVTKLAKSSTEVRMIASVALVLALCSVITIHLPSTLLKRRPVGWIILAAGGMLVAGWMPPPGPQLGLSGFLVFESVSHFVSVIRRRLTER